MQIINAEEYDPLKVDIWSSGITLYAMLCGYLPFDEDSKSLLYEKILSCKFPIPKFLSTGASDLLKKILVRDVKKRLSISQILAHPWLQIPGEGTKSPINHQRHVDSDISKLAALKSNTDEMNIRRMVKDNEHNERTMLYHLLLKRKKRGDPEIEKEIEELAEREISNLKKKVHEVEPSRPDKSSDVQKLPRKLSRKKSAAAGQFLGQTLKSGKGKTGRAEQLEKFIKKLKLADGSKDGKIDKSATQTLKFDKTCSLLKNKKLAEIFDTDRRRAPRINVKDITVEVKEKITFSSDKRSKKRSGSDKPRSSGKNSKRINM